MSKFTPGPWSDGINETLIEDPDGMPICQAYNSVEDARLIAAAPEMYKLLQELRERVSLHPQDIDERARILLARIDGEES